MPYKIIKMKNDCVKVMNTNTGKVKAKKTTIEKAKKQIKLLQLKDKKIYL